MAKMREVLRWSFESLKQLNNAIIVMMMMQIRMSHVVVVFFSGAACKGVEKNRSNQLPKLTQAMAQIQDQD